MAKTQSHSVYTLTGQVLDVLTAEEKSMYETAQLKYTTENTFTDASDMRSLERLLMLELLSFRYHGYLASGLGPDGNPSMPSEEANYHKHLKEMAISISNTAKELGLLKSQKDKERFDTVGAYITDLLNRGEEMGINRENMLDKALELTKELFAKTGAYSRANESERRKMGLDNADVIVDWINNIMKPEFDAVDEHFQEHQQKLWIRKM